MSIEQNTGITNGRHSKRPSGNSGELRALIELEGNFIIPGYQRGYRWNDQQIFSSCTKNSRREKKIKSIFSNR